MKRFVEGEDRSQSTLFPEHLDDYIAEDNPPALRQIDSRKVGGRDKHKNLQSPLQQFRCKWIL
jgi:hypothetical protein